MRVVLSAGAEIDLELIFEASIARWGEQQARRYAEKLDARLALVARGNTRARARPELGEGIHSLPAGSHVIFLKLSNDEALVLGQACASAFAADGRVGIARTT